MFNQTTEWYAVDVNTYPDISSISAYLGMYLLRSHWRMDDDEAAAHVLGDQFWHRTIPMLLESIKSNQLNNTERCLAQAILPGTVFVAHDILELINALVSIDDPFAHSLSRMITHIHSQDNNCVVAFGDISCDRDAWRVYDRQPNGVIDRASYRMYNIKQDTGGHWTYNHDALPSIDELAEYSAYM